MNTTTPSKIAPRRSGRATKANPRFSSPGYVVERPQHRSATPIDATVWSMRYLQRQDVRSQSWFRHLDFAKVPDEDINRSAAPVDATIWSMRYLQRQDVRSQP